MIDKLVHGVEQFCRDGFPAKRSTFQALRHGQNPMALFITCSDSRIDPSLLTQTEPGELFVIRNAGNIVPPADGTATGEAGTLQFAVEVLQVPEIIVCGHSQCGAMKGLLNRESVKALPHVDQWLQFADQSLSRATKSNWLELSDEEKFERLIDANVAQQLEHLKSFPFVANAISKGTLRLHGWVYTFETGKVRVLNQEDESFATLAQAE